MISLPTFRRPLLESEGVCLSRRAATWLGHSLVCHKGNASQSQSSQQTGAQTAGVASSGGQGNISNTGKQVNKAPTVTGNNNDLNASTNITGSTITETDDGAVNAALTALANSNQSAQSNSAYTVEAALSALSQNSIPATPTSDANGNASSSPISDFLSSLTTWQWLAAAAGVLGFVYLIAKRK